MLSPVMQLRVLLMRSEGMSNKQVARSLGISRTGAAIGAIGFSCSGYVASLTENVLYLYSICSVPLLPCIANAIDLPSGEGQG